MTTSTSDTDVATLPGLDTEHVIVTTALTKRYRSGVLAVDDVALRVRRGEVYGFLGPNGAGKTTTMRMLLGLIRPTSGSIRVLDDEPGASALAKYAGVARPSIEAALLVTDLAGRADDRFARYSMGMKLRLGVAAALIKDPDLLILDEPSNGLDPAGMADMRALIRRLGEEGRTVLLSSHQLGEVEQVCDRVGVISGGRLLAESTVAELRGSADLIVGADRADIAARIATGLLGADAVRIAHGKLHCTLEPAQIGGLNAPWFGPRSR